MKPQLISAFGAPVLPATAGPKASPPPTDVATDVYSEAKPANGLPDEVVNLGVSLALQRMFINYAHSVSAKVRGVQVMHVLYKALDARVSTTSEPIVFAGTLRKLLHTPTAIAYLGGLRAAITEAESNRQTLDLWGFTLRFCAGHRQRALQYLAVFFQDMSPSQGAVKYAEAHNLGSATARALLQEVNTQLLNSKHVRLFPVGVKGVRTSNAIYHFYVIARAAQLAAARLPKHQSAAAAAAFTFNNLYEYQKWGAITLPPMELSVSAIQQDVETLRTLGDPATFDIIKRDDDVLDDTYLGYVGALFGIGKERSAIDRASFAAEFSASPQAFIETHFTF